VVSNLTALESTIIENPDDPAGYLVYADYLQTQGDPRGELIVLAHRNGDLTDEHKASLLGRFADAKPDTFELEWQLGFIKSATIGWEMFGGEDEDDPSHAQLAAFLALPAARFLQKLRLGPTAHDEELSMDELAIAIDEARPPCLRTLYLGDTSDWDISSTSTRMPHSASIPQMRELTIHGGQVTLDEEIDLPNLTSFTVETGGLDAASLSAIATARWPKLESLEIWFGDPNYGASGGVDDIKQILAGTDLPALRHLGLRNCSFADELATALAVAPILPRLRSLDLSMGNLSDRGMTTMLDAKQAFAHLETLNVDDNALSSTSWPAARDLAKTVTFGNRHSPERAVPRDDSNRYRRFVSVGE
jgi:uncharacterized protein (TIGR02996 family)